MKKARTETGDIVFAKQYQRHLKSGGAPMKLLCANFNCQADMGARKGGLTHGSAAYRDACFFSRDAKAHVPKCEAYEDLGIRGKRSDSIAEAIARDIPVVINLNMRLSDHFSAAALAGGVAERSVRDFVDYAVVPAKTVDDMLFYQQVIAEKSGEVPYEKVFVNYKRKLMPFSEFLVDSPGKYALLLEKLIVAASEQAQKSEEDSADTVKTFPRLIAFSPVKAEGTKIDGTTVTLARDDGRKLYLTQKVEAVPALRAAMRDEPVMMIAEPRLNRADLAAAVKALETTSMGGVILPLRWRVIGAHQVVPVEKPDARKQVQAGLAF